jgi:hypothetical protein
MLSTWSPEEQWNMPISAIDHLVVTAPNLAVGVDYVEQTLRCKMQPGGQHPRMGTHNALLRLGRECYLEVIAIDPEATPPQRRRWFELDAMTSDSPPRLAGWVMRTNEIHRVAQLNLLDTGSIEEMSRGSLEWQITIPSDGRFVCGGIAPSVIQWKGETHPASRLQDSHVTLVRLEARHPDAQRINNWLASAGFEESMSIQAPVDNSTIELTALLQTPSGLVRFR